MQRAASIEFSSSGANRTIGAAADNISGDNCPKFRHERGIHFMKPFTKLLGVLSGLLAAAQAPAQFPGQKTYCNPLDIDYKYNFEQQARGISFRSGADPVIVNHKGEYYLFVTISGG